MENKPKIESLIDTSLKDVSALPIDLLSSFYDELAKMNSISKKIKSKLDEAVLFKYNDVFIKDIIGTTNHTDVDFNIKLKVGKSVSWDQDKLKAVSVTIKDEWNANPNEYIDVKLSVSENKFNAWPEATRNLFMDARSIKPTSPTIEIKEKK